MRGAWSSRSELNSDEPITGLDRRGWISHLYAPATGLKAMPWAGIARARVVELADTQDSGSCDRKVVGVRLSPRAPGFSSR